MKYKCFGLDSLQICKSEPRLNYTTINNYHWFIDPIFACNVKEYFKDGRPKSTVNPRMHYMIITVTSSGCLKLYLNP